MSTQRFTILHVEDDPNDVLLVHRAFQKNDSSAVVRSVADGDQALSYLAGTGAFSNPEENPFPDVVLLDLKMPRRSGLEVLEWIRHEPNLKRVIVVIFTSSRHDQDIKRAYDLGANSYLVKPIGFEALQETIKQMNNYWGRLNQAPGSLS